MFSDYLKCRTPELCTNFLNDLIFLSALKGIERNPFECSSEMISVLASDVIAASISNIDMKYWELYYRSSQLTFATLILSISIFTENLYSYGCIIFRHALNNNQY